MPASRWVIFSLLLALTVLSPRSPAQADQAFQRLLPLFVDLDGWAGEKPYGNSGEEPDPVTFARRDYARGSAWVQTLVVAGGQFAASELEPLFKGMNFTTSSGRMLTTVMNDMQLLKFYSDAEKSGLLMVALDQNAMFRLVYSGCSEEEALALAQKFDWKAIQAAAKSK